MKKEEQKTNLERVELHTHTKMSTMDSIIDIKELISYSAKLGQNAIAITDYNSCQAFPEIYKTVTDYNNEHKETEQFKILYGAEINIENDRAILISKNQSGLKNLYKILSLVNTKYLSKNKSPKIPIQEIKQLHEGLFIGYDCIHNKQIEKTEVQLANRINFYDYIEIQPLSAFSHLIGTGKEFETIEEAQNYLKNIIKMAKSRNKLVVATGNVHYLKEEDKIGYEILKNRTDTSNYYLRTTEEMLKEFSFLEKDLAYEIVIENPNKIANLCEEIEIIKNLEKPFIPKIIKSKEVITESVYSRAKEIYGNTLPMIVEERIKTELEGIIESGHETIFLIAQKLVKYSNDKGFLVGSRGSVGSSFIAFLLGITEINPLPAHYRCPKCQYSIFKNKDNRDYSTIYSCGMDLPEKNCPKCNEKMKGDGYEIPFETFLGIGAKALPDIDLNFSDMIQKDVQDYLQTLFGKNHVYRAGTIGTISLPKAYEYVKNYCEEKNIDIENTEKEKIAEKLVGIKRTNGQHPGGILVFPEDIETEEITPIHYLDNNDNKWGVTHFDYHTIDSTILKFDILGHSDFTMLKVLQDLTHIDITKIPLNDKDTMKIFSDPKILGVTKEDIMCELGTLGIPEFDTPFTMQLIKDTKPTTFAELIKISGFSHGTNVWKENAEVLLKENKCLLKDTIACRDDIMNNLMHKGMDRKNAFKIMEFVRKGRPKKSPEDWNNWKNILIDYNLPHWYIPSCEKILYMFPKAHCASYVTNAFRIAWFKVHKPLAFYAAYFNVNVDIYEPDVIEKGYDAIKTRILEIQNKGENVTNQELYLLDSLKVALEACARGIKFKVNKNERTNFLILEEENILLIPFRSIK